MKKYVYTFNEGSGEMIQILGSRGAALAEMTNMGLPVPFGMTVRCEAFSVDLVNGKAVLKEEARAQLEEKMNDIQEVMGKVFGDEKAPLLLSVRLSNVHSGVGQTGTVLNVGLNDELVESYEFNHGNYVFSYDCYRRLIKNYGIIVLGLDRSQFNIIEKVYLKRAGVDAVDRLSLGEIKDIIRKMKTVIKIQSGKIFPQDVKTQMTDIMKAMAVKDSGGAINIQAMVYGNRSDGSCSAVCFTRNPATGNRELYGEFLSRAQGTDLLDGFRIPSSINALRRLDSGIYEQIENISAILESHFKEMMEIKFVVEDGRLYVINAWPGRRTAAADIKIAADMEKEKLLTRDEALLKIQPSQLDQLLHPGFDSEAEENAVVISEGIAASPGAACGKIYFDSEDAVKARRRGEKVILVKSEVNNADILGIIACEGLLMDRGGVASYAAMICRGIGKCCVSGCENLSIDKNSKILRFDRKVFSEGDFISINGNKGAVYGGEIKTVPAVFSREFDTIMKWADEKRELKIRGNADNVTELRQVIGFGADGIGLFRTENMFYGPQTSQDVKKIIESSDHGDYDDEESREAYNRLVAVQKDNFKIILKQMDGKPITIRTLNVPPEGLIEGGDSFLGKQGIRISVLYPKLLKMQIEALTRAYIELSGDNEELPQVEIIVPMASERREIVRVKKSIGDTVAEIAEETGYNRTDIFQIGALIEVPRAALTADEIVQEVDFFSFGTNDLTQMVYGLHRDDRDSLIGDYVEMGMYQDDPFSVLDIKGVGSLIKTGVQLGRKEKPWLKVGICGEHGGDPVAIDFCRNLDIDYVSCSPYRVPVAKLSAAQAEIRRDLRKRGIHI